MDRDRNRIRSSASTGKNILISTALRMVNVTIESILILFGSVSVYNVLLGSSYFSGMCTGNSAGHLTTSVLPVKTPDQSLGSSIVCSFLTCRCAYCSVICVSDTGRILFIITADIWICAAGSFFSIATETNSYTTQRKNMKCSFTRNTCCIPVQHSIVGQV